MSSTWIVLIWWLCFGHSMSATWIGSWWLQFGRLVGGFNSEDAFREDASKLVSCAETVHTMKLVRHLCNARSSKPMEITSN